MATVLSTAAPIRERPHQPAIFPVSDQPHEISVQPRRLLRHGLILEPSTLLNRETQRTFRAAGYSLRSIRSWSAALEMIETGEMDAVLLDIDAIDASVSRLNVSACRLITLMRRLPTKATCPVIAAISQRDYSEIQEHVHAGVHVCASKQTSLISLVHQIEAARQRLHPPVYDLAG